MRYTTQFLLSALAAEQFPAPSVPEIAFLGRSNVGKSSLLNALLRHARAIVTPIPGTTRDTIEESLEIHGIPIVAVDTAGPPVSAENVNGNFSPCPRKSWFMAVPHS